MASSFQQAAFLHNGLPPQVRVKDLHSNIYIVIHFIFIVKYFFLQTVRDWGTSTSVQSTCR